MAPPTQFRCSVAGPELLQKLAAEPLPLGLTEQSSTTSFHRDLYFDTPDGALQAHGVVCRLRYRADGRCVLSLKSLKVKTLDDPMGQHIKAELEPQEPMAALTGDNEPARRLRAFADAALLKTRIELAVSRTTRVARSGWHLLGRVECLFDDVTLRHGELSGTFQELKVRRSGWGGPSLEELTRAWVEQHELRPSLVTSWSARKRSGDASRRRRSPTSSAPGGQ